MKSLLSIVLSFCFVAIQAQGIEFFHGTYQEAIKEAQKQEKIIFVDAYTTWCGPCKRMSKQVFSQASAGEFFNENFINLKIDMEKPNGREFGSNYPVSAYPTLFFLDSDGKIVKKTVGGKSLDALLGLGKEIIEKYDFSLNYKKAYDAGDRSYENTIAYVNALNKSNKSSLKIANEFLLQNKDLSPQQKSDFIFAAASELDSKVFEQMLENKDMYIKQMGQEAFTEKIMYGANRTLRKALEFESTELLNLATKTVKKYNKSEYKTFLAESYMKKAAQEENVAEYSKNSKKFIKTLTSTPAKIKWAQNAMSLFPKNQDILQLAAETLKAPLAESTNKNDITFYTKILLEQKKNKEALEYVKKAEAKVTDGATKKHLLNLINYIEKQTS